MPRQQTETQKRLDRLYNRSSEINDQFPCCDVCTPGYTMNEYANNAVWNLREIARRSPEHQIQCELMMMDLIALQEAYL